ncbi:CvfB family protein [Thermaerobacillus caldiproteolyticus]|uniref:CvfB family protein n=1 Tax=Thermaerobacillus caldiproteolyticus TaxID=247480 RepID=UPI00188BE001|nr:S1 RNA-binding domain-containing protein [Anoxybacillus caldiproteolyticus]QPA31691.1 S1 RNA-binding domain-containing protein [Anoxybacillus caldiproteolyticus]
MERFVPGEITTLTVKREVPFGYFLTNGKEEVLLPKNETEHLLAIEEPVTVFLYHDHQGRLCATTKTPKITNETYGWVEVADVVPKLGVFVNIGISKDVLVSIDDLPTLPSLWPQRGDMLYCSLKTDKRGRLLAQLATDEVMKEIAIKAPESVFNQNICGRVYRVIKVGAFIISDVGYLGFIHESQRRREPRLGEAVEGRIIGVKEDGTVNVSLLPRKHESIDEDAQMIYRYMESRGGAMPYSDKSDPEDIQARFQMSKAAFKRALGRLMKEKKVYQESGWTYTVKEK